MARPVLLTIGLIALVASLGGALITGCGIFLLGTISLEPPLPYASADLTVGMPKELIVELPAGSANAEVHNLLPYVDGGEVACAVDVEVDGKVVGREEHTTKTKSCHVSFKMDHEGPVRVRARLLEGGYATAKLYVMPDMELPYGSAARAAWKVWVFLGAGFTLGLGFVIAGLMAKKRPPAGV